MNQEAMVTVDLGTMMMTEVAIDGDIVIEVAIAVVVTIDQQPRARTCPIMNEESCGKPVQNGVRNMKKNYLKTK
jgi:hypothetical protein